MTEVANVFQPYKVQIYILKTRKPLIHNYYIATPPIKEVTSIRYLGVWTDSKLTWNNHIQYITHKVAQVHGFLYCNLRQCSPPI